MPATMPIRLMMTCTVTNVDKLIPRIMMRSPFRTDQTLWPSTGNCHSPIREILIQIVRRMASMSRAAFVESPDQSSAVEKFHQLRDHLVRRFLHQPVSAIPDEHALDIGRHHLALLDQERTAGFFA